MIILRCTVISSILAMGSYLVKELFLLHPGATSLHILPDFTDHTDKSTLNHGHNGLYLFICVWKGEKIQN